MGVGCGGGRRPSFRSLWKAESWSTELGSYVSGDLSSISGSEDSDSASEEDLQMLHEEKPEFEKSNRSRGFRSHRVLFQNAQGQFLYAYRCVLGPHQASDSTGCMVNSKL